jgi:hypothetical protein
MRRIAWVIVPIILVGLLGLAVFATRGPGATTAFTLKPGDCFDIPADAQIGDIPTLDCTQPHDAEVFVAKKMLADAPSGPVAYPGAAQIAVWVQNSCGLTAEEAYLGAGSTGSGLVVGYFFPDADAWAHGQQQVTCYLHASDGSKQNAPARAGTTEPSASPS